MTIEIAGRGATNGVHMLNAGRRQGSRGPEGTAADAESFHREVRRRRCARGLSRDELAARTGYSRQYVSQLEQPSRGVPARPVVVAVDAALDADGALITLRDTAAAIRAEQAGRPRDAADESRHRVQKLLANRRRDDELDYLDRTVGELIALAGSLGPCDIRDRVLHQQEIVDGLLGAPMLPHQQLRLFLIAGHLAGLLAIALLDLGELSGACTCCLEAAVFTDLTGHAGLRAWTLAVNRLVTEAARHAEALADRSRDSGIDDLTIVTEVDEMAVPGVDGPYEELVAESTCPPWRGLGDLLTASSGRASTPLLVALAKGRIAQFATTSARRERPLAGLSRAFHPPV
jgi:transcriptional regulator with XRE-family HTH domain